MDMKEPAPPQQANLLIGAHRNAGIVPRIKKRARPPGIAAKMENESETEPPGIAAKMENDAETEPPGIAAKIENVAETARPKPTTAASLRWVRRRAKGTSIVIINGDHRAPLSFANGSYLINDNA